MQIHSLSGVAYLSLQGVISGAIGMSLQWIMKYPNADPADMKSTTLLTPDVDYEFACFAERLL